MLASYFKLPLPRRGLRFIQVLLQSLADGEKDPNNPNLIKVNVIKAYEQALKKYHGWGIRTVFSVRKTAAFLSSLLFKVEFSSVLIPLLLVRLSAAGGVVCSSVQVKLPQGPVQRRGSERGGLSSKRAPVPGELHGHRGRHLRDVHEPECRAGLHRLMFQH